VDDEVATMNPVRTRLPKGATARTPGFARGSNDLGTE